MTGSESLIPFRRKKRPAPVARVRPGEPTPDSRSTYDVVIGEGQMSQKLAVFRAGERSNAVDFANGFNLGTRWQS